MIKRPNLAVAFLQILVQRTINFGQRMESFTFDNTSQRLARIAPAARGKLELSFGGQALTSPFAVGNSVFECDMHDGMVHPAGDIRLGTSGCRQFAPVT